MPGSWLYPCAFSKLISLSSNLPQFLNSRPDLNSFPVEPGSYMSAFLPNSSWVAEISLDRTVRWLRVTCKSVCCFVFFSIITCLPSWVLRDNLWNYAWGIFFSLDLVPQGTLPCLKADNTLPRSLLLESATEPGRSSQRMTCHGKKVSSWFIVILSLYCVSHSKLLVWD